MLQIFPFVVYLAAITSAILLAVLWSLGELSRLTMGFLLTWFVAAAYCQFLAGSQIVAASGLLFQTILAVYLIARWRLSS